MNGDYADWGDAPLHHPSVATQELTCPSAPLQIEGQFTDGRHYYFRCRHGIAELGIGTDLEAAILDTFTRPGIRVGGPFHTSRTVDEINTLFAQLYETRMAEEMEASP